MKTINQGKFSFTCSDSDAMRKAVRNSLIELPLDLRPTPAR